VAVVAHAAGGIPHSIWFGRTFSSRRHGPIAVAVVAHAAGGIPHSIWFGRTFSSAGKEILDGVGYGIVTGLVFALLW